MQEIIHNYTAFSPSWLYGARVDTWFTAKHIAKPGAWERQCGSFADIAQRVCIGASPLARYSARGLGWGMLSAFSAEKTLTLPSPGVPGEGKNHPLRVKCDGTGIG
jgi:hypothetical protein